jgi:CheY-like chemotaxis protein
MNSRDTKDDKDDKQVLVVEDDHAIREIEELLLHAEGYEVLEAPDGVVGLALLARNKGALVALVDYRMPHIDGYELLQAVAAGGNNLQRHAYILVTANRDVISPRFEQLLSSHNIPIVAKPFDIDILLDAVAHAHHSLEAGGSWHVLVV